METVAPFQEVIDEVKEKGGDAVKFCYQCGKCDTVCPWNRVRKFSMRKLIREATFGLSEIESEEEVEEEVRPGDIEIGLDSLADKFGLQKVLETVDRMAKKA